MVQEYGECVCRRLRDNKVLVGFQRVWPYKARWCTHVWIIKPIVSVSDCVATIETENLDNKEWKLDRWFFENAIYASTLLIEIMNPAPHPHNLHIPSIALSDVHTCTSMFHEVAQTGMPPSYQVTHMWLHNSKIKAMDYFSELSL